MRFLYRILFYFALPYSLLRLLWRSFEEKAYRQNWGERLGFYPAQLEKSIWVHAASVGETIAAIPLVKALQRDYPQLPIVFTTMTITGRARAHAAFNDTVKQSYIPYDTVGATNRFLNRIKPKAVIVLETELWPTMFKACFDRHIPVVVTNARLSAKSANGYRKIAKLTRDMLQHITVLAVQTQTEADRFIALGLPAERARVTGNIKFDLEVPSDLAAKTIQLRAALGQQRAIWVAASTHAGEEEKVIAAHIALLKKYPQALCIIVPRHPARFDSVYQLCLQAGLRTKRRSLNEACDDTTQVYLADTMGEMLLIYSVADVAFVAGSFVNVGGHNMLEASVLGKPVISGEILHNFAEISQALIAAHGMLTVQDEKGLEKALDQLFTDADYRITMGEQGKQFVTANRGALDKQLQAIATVL